jgi:hypothetical protein
MVADPNNKNVGGLYKKPAMSANQQLTELQNQSITIPNQTACLRYAKGEICCDLKKKR